ncbi:MAG TPA: cysteine synthase family protein [Blastocatellia bacterium]|jgi:cysteine synthase A|nr:cysteine synthase family protein [Blastocatellia bacterium]
MDHNVYSTVVEATIFPRIIRLGKNLYAAAFFLMKLLPARLMLDRAGDAGLIGPGSVVIETSSGTFGLALALLCNLRGYRLILVSDSAIDLPLQRRLEDLSASVEIVKEPAPVGGFQQARLDRMSELRAAHPNHFWPSQYDNADNPDSYVRLAELLARSVDKIDCLVGAVGSGGSMCGTSSHLRVKFPHLKAVGVDTHGSVLFGQPDRKRLLRGLGNSLMPKNLNHSAFDEVHWVSAAEAFTATRNLHRQQGLYVGPTSGASYLAARWWAEKNPDANVVVLFADEGYRYQNNVYDDEWLSDNSAWLPSLPPGPTLVQHPSEAGPGWSHIDWNRRTYEQVLGQSFSVKAHN